MTYKVIFNDNGNRQVASESIGTITAARRFCATRFGKMSENLIGEVFGDFKTDWGFTCRDGSYFSYSIEQDK